MDEVTTLKRPSLTKTTAYATTRGASPKGPSLMEGFAEPEQQLQDELSSDRIMNLRADAGEQFVENLRLPDARDLWIPGYRIITEQLARESGLRGLEDDPFPDLPLEEEQPATGAVDGNMVESFVDGVTGQQKIDVLNSCLLAQLAANAKFKRVEQPVEWSNAYGTILMNLAWVVPTFSFRNLRTSAQRFTIDQVILKLVQGFLNPDQISKLTATMEAMKALESNDRRFVIFERNAKKQSDGNFQINSVGASAGGTLSMKFNAYAFDTNTEVTNILWFSFSGNSTSLKVSQSTFVLNEQVYARLRDPIVNKLGNRGVDYIGGLELAEG
ncbi:hypothetical protein E0493_21205 [Roseomonas sp. M0104]|uniref:Uncharacterized protein n=1 Tax=Teichococcus coralli TaxID=2545983 RepID=A0A845BE71_9PROT|nr:hypothetical protein [Pseudoroseomonas coralli]MXP65873.1 hypothetical protein [Pseudoroseomonas coralli]